MAGRQCLSTLPLHRSARNRSGYTGVFPHGKHGWRAVIKDGPKLRHLGSYPTLELAAESYAIAHARYAAKRLERRKRAAARRNEQAERRLRAKIDAWRRIHNEKDGERRLRLMRKYYESEFPPLLANCFMSTVGGDEHYPEGYANVIQYLEDSLSRMRVERASRGGGSK
jgi:hypothetical protein